MFACDPQLRLGQAFNILRIRLIDLFFLICRSNSIRFVERAISTLTIFQSIA
jgi:hypothetical protein